jgi:flagellar assembly factor FliW
MVVDTVRFGEIEIEPSRVLTLDEGLLGFPEQRRYCLLEHAPGSPVQWLQSVDEPGLAFLVVNPHDFFVDYELELSDELATAMELERPEEAAVLVLVSVQESRRLTANLVGPVVINTRTGRGRQLVLDSDCYTTRHLLGVAAPQACACSAA